MSFDPCKQNSDARKLVREGLSQPQRALAALAPDFAPVDEHGPAHRMIFARAFSAYLRFFNEKNVDAGDWQPFFSTDLSVQLAVASVQDLDVYQASIKACFDVLDDRDNADDAIALRLNLGRLFGSAATLAAQLDQLAMGLPSELPFTALLRNVVRHQLAPALKSLLLYHRDGLAGASAPCLTDAAPLVDIFGAAHTLPQALTAADRTMSNDWIFDDAATAWPQYLANLADAGRYPDTGVFGTGATLFDRVNHIATHSLFTSIFDRFVKVYSRVVSAAADALEASFTARDTHEPHYGLFLAFLRLFERVRAESNTLTARHLDFYYCEVLRLKAKDALPGHVHLLGELAKSVPNHLLAKGTRVKAGKDASGRDVYFTLTRDTVLNQARVAALQTLYRHDSGRLYAWPVANSSDGRGAPLTPEQPSWHPFHNETSVDGKLSSVAMLNATVGFAIASHYLLLAEGDRTIELHLSAAGVPPGVTAGHFECLLSTTDGWLTKGLKSWKFEGRDLLTLSVTLDGADPAIVACQPKVHGARFGDPLPVLQVLLKQRADSDGLYGLLQDVVVSTCELTVAVTGLKSLSVSNDFGPVETSKPFQPFGAMPVAGSALILGAREVFQKHLRSASVQMDWLTKAVPYPSTTTLMARVECLVGGQWKETSIAANLLGDESPSAASGEFDLTVRDAPDLSPPEFFDNGSRHGYVRLCLKEHLGQVAYQTALITFLRSGGNDPGPPPTPPVLAALSMSYAATQIIRLSSNDSDAFDHRTGRYFHVAPFGQAEQHPRLSSDRKVRLLPQFAFGRTGAKVTSAGELYIGVTGLKPPQDLALLMQVVPGTSNPLAEKPDPHVRWSYLSGNEWTSFRPQEVSDRTSGLIASGIVTLHVPAAASADNSLLASGMHWFRLAAPSKTDAVCRLLSVAAQAMEAQFEDQGNAPTFPATVLPPGVATKLVVPDAALKQLSQPFASFGGSGAETASDFRVRVSERLRHKDRAIALWDYEHLVLSAFPAIYKVKCLNHTQYEPSDGGGIYRELAPGHVTIITVPRQQALNSDDALRPYTPLDVLVQIERFLKQRCGCFIKLHVRNPQFEEVHVDFKVSLLDGIDETFHVNLLKTEITRFLSPWAYDDGAAPTFGGKIYKSALINFVEAQAYVDYVTDFKLYREGVPGDQTEVNGSKAVAVLVSAPAERHRIVVLPPSTSADSAESCPCEASP